MKKFFLIGIGILNLAMVSSYAIAEEVAPCIITPSEKTEAVNITPSTADSVNIAPATLVTAPVPKNKKTLFIADNADLDRYMRYLQRRVESKWYPPSFEENRRAVINFSVARNGKIYNPKVVISSNDETFDKVAMEAIDADVSLLPLPSEVKPNIIDMQFTFDSASFGNNCHCMSYYNTDSSNYKNVSNGSESSYVYAAYQKEIDKIVSYNAPQREYFFPKKASVYFTVDKTGSIKDFTIGTSTKSINYLIDVEKSLKVSQFPPIPESIAADSLEFNYNLVSPPYNHKNKNLIKCCGAYLARALTIIRTGH